MVRIIIAQHWQATENDYLKITWKHEECPFFKKKKVTDSDYKYV